jgi:propanol-preferring alcohol dehydrogenase
MGQAVRCLGILGRAAIVALSRESLSFFPYTELINKEVEIIGVSDHLASELPSLMRYAQSGKLTFPDSALRFVDLDAAQINAALDALEGSTDHVRTVIVPTRGTNLEARNPGRERIKNAGKKERNSKPHQT